MKNQLNNFFILSLFIFLIFCLVLEPKLQLPAVLVWSGRLHPLILHFPIVLVILSISLNWIKKYDGIGRPIKIIAVYAVLITAISGLFLSLENETKGNLLLTHQWLGAGVAIAFTILYWINIQYSTSWAYRILQILILILIVATGHYGGMVTHGENFLAFDFNKKIDQTPLPENPVIYEQLVLPVLEKNVPPVTILIKRRVS